MFVYAKPEQKPKQKFKSTAQKKKTEKISSTQNLTGIPDNMKTEFESTSGFSFDDVRVHYNSNKPSQLQALAYTQGNRVYIGPGQEKHLGHELGHVLQQKQGKVKPTMQERGVNVNDSESLEKEADLVYNKCLLKKETVQRKMETTNFHSDTAVIQLLKNSEITTTKERNGMSKKDAIYYRTNRPPYAKGQVEAVWAAAPKDKDGYATCPNTGKKISWTPGNPRESVWDMGHKTGHEYRVLWEQVATCIINAQEFFRQYQDPDNYQVEDCSANRSHTFESG